MKTVELDDSEVRLIVKALRDKIALLEFAIDGFKKAYGDEHYNFSAPLSNQVDDATLILAKLGEIS